MLTNDNVRLEWHVMRRSVGTAAVLAVLLPALVLVWIRMRTDDRLDAISPVPSPITHVVESRPDTRAVGVSVEIRWLDGETVAAPSWSGTVTGLHLSPGDVIGSNDLVASVDGIDRVAITTPTPLYRHLGRGDTGDDVAHLQAVLAGMGWFDGDADGRYGPGTVAAVRAFATYLGVARPDGRFDPAWVVWLPSTSFAVGSVDATVGFPAPAPGTAWLRGPQVVAEVTLVQADGARLKLDGDAWELWIGDAVVALHDGLPNLQDMERVTQRPSDGETTVSVSGRVLRADAPDVPVVPAAAVVAGTDGEHCVYTPEGAPLPVVLGRGETGTVFIDSGVETGTRILVNPADVIADPSCR